MVINKSKKSRSFGSFDPWTITSYYYNKTACMTMQIFLNWLSKFNRRMKNENRHVLLLVDNAPGHKLSDESLETITNVKIEYLQPNTTSVLPPCDAGIINSL